MSKTKDKALTPSSSSTRINTMQDDSVPMPASEVGSVSKPRGYPLGILNGKADEKFCCSYCKYILRNPMQSSCGHRFCQECLKMMETLPETSQCQSCVEEGITDDDSYLDFQEIFEDKAARREMRKLQVKCMYQGCPWRGSFNDFIKHEEDCEKKMMLCSQCGASVSKARLASHETKNCPKRVIHCPFCREEFVFEFKDKHNEECPKYLVKCERCLSSVERYKLLKHQETVCANRMMICPLPECNTKLPMDKFLAHINKDEILAKHITYLLDLSYVVDQRLETIENRLQYTDVENACVDPSSNIVSSVPGGDHIQASGSSQESEGIHGEGVQADGAGGRLIHEDRQKLKLHEDLMSVLHSEILRCITKLEAMGRVMEKHDNRLKDCYAKIEGATDRLTILEAKFKEMSRNPFDSYGELLSEGLGSFTWIIKNYNRVNEDKDVICSPTFFSCPSGYQMRLKMYANGEGSENRNNYVSLYLQTVKGPNDDLLLWPFYPKVHFMLVDQAKFKQHYVKTHEMEPISPSSRRPSEDVGVASGCPAFISVPDMNTKKLIYWPNNIVYLKFHIEMPKTNVDRINSLNPCNYVTNSSSSASSVKS